MSLLPRHRQLPLVALAACLALPAAGAQPLVTPALDAAVGLTRAPTDAWRDVRALSPSLGVQTPWLSAFAAGDVAAGSSALRGLGWRGTAAASTPSVRGFHLTVSGAFVSTREPVDVAGDPVMRSVRYLGAGQLAFRRGGGGAWLGYERLAAPVALDRVGATSAGDTTRAAYALAESPARLSAGAWRALGRAVATVEVRSGITRAPDRAPTLRYVDRPQAYFDTIARRWDTTMVRRPVMDSGQRGWARRGTDVEARLAWQRGRVALTSVAGVQLVEWLSAPDGSPTARVGHRGWAGVDAAVALGTRTAIVAMAGTRPRTDVASMLAGSPWPATGSARYATLALRLSPSAFTRPALPPVVRTAAAAFTVQPTGGGRYALRVRAPAARLVEVTGDFTGWQPVAMRRVESDVWEVVVRMTPGTHQLNIRVDGDGWRAPPGTTTVTDDYNGSVGVIVV